METEKTYQEEMVNDLLPSIRRFVSIKYKERGFTQKEIARLMGLTEGAISQYISRMRGKKELNDRQKELIILYMNNDKKMNFSELLNDVWRLK